MGWELSSSRSRSLLKWLSFMAALWLMICVGTQDTFALYSPVLKAVMNLDELQVLTLAAAKETGKGLGVLAGFASFLLPLWVMPAVSIVESILGFGFLWLVVSQRIQPPSYSLMYVICWITGNSITFMNTAAIVVALQNFPFNRGTVVGILKGLQILSGAIYVQLGTIVFSNNVESFLLLLTFLPASSCVIGISLVKRVPPVMSRRETHEDRTILTFIGASTIVLALYMLSYNISSTLTHLSQVASNLYIVVLAVFIAAPVAVPVRAFIWSYFAGKSEVDDGVMPKDDGITDPLLLRPNAENTKESAPLIADSYSNESQWMYAVTRANQSKDLLKPAAEDSPEALVGENNSAPSSSSQDDITIEAPPPLATNAPPKQKKMLKKIGSHHFSLFEAFGFKEWWLLFFSFFCGIGMSIILENNLSRVVEALGYQDVAILLTISSVSTFFGTVLGGALSEFLIKLAAIPRPFLGVIVQAIMVVNYVQLALGFPGSLFLGVLFAGITAGVQMTIAVATASELFGLKYIGMLYNFLLLVYPLALAGKYFSGVLVEKLYDHEAHNVGATIHMGSTMDVLVNWAKSNSMKSLHAFGDDEVEACVGVHCFRWIFLIMATVSAFGVALNVGLIIRTRRHYRAWYWHDSLLAQAEDVPPAPLLISHS